MTNTKKEQQTIIIVCDYPIIVSELENLLSASFNLKRGKESNADLAVLCAFEFSGKDVRELKKRCKNVVLLTDVRHVEIPAFLLRAVAVISLRETGEKLLNSLKDIIADKTLYSPLAAVEIVNRMVRPQQKNENELTKREREVYGLLHLSNKEIADRLYISASTVRYYVREINRKLGMNVRKTLKL